MQSVTSYDTIYETPKRTPRTRIQSEDVQTHRANGPSLLPRKRLAETPILLDAVERALDSGSKRQKQSNMVENTPRVQRNHLFKSRLSRSFDGDVALATPDAGDDQQKVSKSKSKLRKVEQPSTSKSDSRMHGEDDMTGSRPSASRDRRSESRQVQLDPLHKRSEQFSRPAREGTFHSAVSATPPIADEDLELVGQQETSVDYIPQHRPTPLDTLVAQDASLPSPSLSPITAAATLANPHTAQNAEEEDDGDDVSSLDIEQNNAWARRKREVRKHKMLGQSRLDIPLADAAEASRNPQLPTPTVMDIPTMLDSFDAMPTELQTYVIYQMLRRCNKTTLHTVADVVNPALKCDFLALLPLELSMNVVRHFDVQTMCRTAQVSKKWRQIVDSDETAWKTLLHNDGLAIPNGEMERAVREGWGWQYPQRHDRGEEDLSQKYGARQEEEVTSPASSVTADSEYAEPKGVSRPKRKAASKSSGSNKKRKTKAPPPSIAKTQIAPWVKSLEDAQGPIAHANAAAMAVPNPNVGLSSLQNLHLYKSIYRRHHAIKKGWMEEETQPHHIAFRAHGRHVVTCLQFDSDKIITGSDDTRIHIYDTKTGREIKQLIGHEGGVWALQYDGNILVSGSTDRSVRVWDIEKGRCIQQFLGHTSTVRCLVILKPTKIGEDENGQPINMPKEPLIITGSRDSSLRVWKLPALGDRSIIQSGHHAQDTDNPYFIRALTGHQHSVRAIAAHGDTLVSGSYDSTVRVWRISNGDLLHRLQGHTAKVYSVVLDHERNRCISGSMDNTVRIWSIETGQQLYGLDGHTSLVGLLDLGYGRLVSAAADSTLRIWDPENGHCKNTLSAHTGAITCFQHDDQKVISGSDRTLKLWNVKTGGCVKDLLTDLSGVWQVKFNDRRCVAAVQRDNLTYIEVRI
jgi:F-box and WD-40 domain protein CDC4